MSKVASIVILLNCLLVTGILLYNNLIRDASIYHALFMYTAEKQTGCVIPHSDKL